MTSLNYHTKSGKFVMYTAIEDYFGNPDAFYESISLHKKLDLKWEEIFTRVPCMPKGWFELSKLSETVRLEFIRDFWFNTLPYFPHVYTFLDRFFAELEAIGVYAALHRDKSRFQAFLVYTMRGRSEFFLGRPPIQKEQIDQMKKEIEFPFPEDYLQFMQVHNGFQRVGDTGIFPSDLLLSQRGSFLDEIEQNQCGIKYQRELIDPKDLFPFYQSFGPGTYQCFYKNWYPDEQVGNVLCSLSDGTISHYKNTQKGRETLAFHTFLDWFIFYLEEAKDEVL